MQAVKGDKMRYDAITPNDNGIMGACDSESIANAIKFAIKQGEKEIVIPRKNERTDGQIWEISETILLPSDFTVILDNCHLRLADGVYANIFRNENVFTEKSRTPEGEQKNITIRGEGYAVLDGGRTNFLLESNFSTVDTGNPLAGMRINNLILLHNVNGFRLENFELRNQRWWGINCLFCSNGNVSDVVSAADNSIPNQDGLDLRVGCRDINIERVSGAAGDDLIALTALCGGDLAFSVEGKDIHVHNVKIKDVIGTSVKQGGVVLRNQDDAELYDIEIENVIHSNGGNNNFKGYVTVRVGENGYFKKHESTMGSTRNISVTNVIGSTSATIMVGATLKNCTFKNIRADGGYWVFLAQGVKMENVSIDGVYYEQRFFEKQSGPYGLIEDVNPVSPNGFMRKDDYVKNLRINDYVNVSGEKKIFVDDSVENEIYLDGEKLC